MPKTKSTKPKRLAVSAAEMRVSAGGHFFRPTNNLDDAAVSKLFKAILSGWASGKHLIHDVRVARQHRGKSYRYSLLCIKMKPTPPPFLPTTSLREQRYGFVLLIEVAGIVGIFKRGPSGFEDWLDTACTAIGRRELTRAFNQSSVYSKVSLRRMSVSRHELRACSYEASDLATAIPALGLSRSIPRFIRLNRKNGEIVSITPNTSRITRTGKKLSIDELAVAVSEIAAEFTTASTESFLDHFSMPADLALLPNTIVPTGVLFDLAALDASSDRDALHLIIKRKANRELDVTNTLRKRLVEILPVSAGTGLHFGNVGGGIRGKVLRNRSDYSLKLRFGSKVVVRNAEGQESPFHVWIRTERPYSLSFNSPEYFYTHGHLYQVPAFDKEIARVEAAITVEAALTNTTSEKGDTDRYTASTRRFGARSIFSVVEQTIFGTSKHLWCCDLGDEWADYISINPQNGGQITFVHCKAGDATSGASAFQEVVGQAIKNLGRVQVNPKTLLTKISDLRQKPRWGNTSIPRHRGTGSLEQDAESVVGSPDARRVVALVVTMMSKSKFDVAKQEKKPHFIQLVWLLASFINSCREMGAKPSIICQP